MSRSKLIALVFLGICALFAIVRISGQSFGDFSRDQPYLILAKKSSGGDGSDCPSLTFTGTLETICGIRNHWRSDTNVLTTDANIVTNWVDFVSSAPFNHATTRIGSPSNLTDGVYFDGFTYASWLTNSMGLLSSNNFTLVLIGNNSGYVYNPESVIIANGGSSANLISVLKSDSSIVFSLSTFKGAISPPSVSGEYDITITVHPSSQNITSYWNGVFFTNFSGVSALSSFSANTFGMGHGPGSDYFTGFIKDFAIYTNNIGAIGASNVHYYHTVSY